MPTPIRCSHQGEEESCFLGSSSQEHCGSRHEGDSASFNLEKSREESGFTNTNPVSDKQVTGKIEEIPTKRLNVSSSTVNFRYQSQHGTGSADADRKACCGNRLDCQNDRQIKLGDQIHDAAEESVDGKEKDTSTSTKQGCDNRCFDTNSTREYRDDVQCANKASCQKKKDASKPALYSVDCGEHPIRCTKIGELATDTDAAEVRTAIKSPLTKRQEVIHPCRLQLGGKIAEEEMPKADVMEIAPKQCGQPFLQHQSLENNRSRDSGHFGTDWLSASDIQRNEIHLYFEIPFKDAQYYCTVTLRYFSEFPTILAKAYVLCVSTDGPVYCKILQWKGHIPLLTCKAFKGLSNSVICSKTSMVRFIFVSSGVYSEQLLSTLEKQDGKAWSFPWGVNSLQRLSTYDLLDKPSCTMIGRLFNRGNEINFSLTPNMLPAFDCEAYEAFANLLFLANRPPIDVFSKENLAHNTERVASFKIAEYAVYCILVRWFESFEWPSQGIPKFQVTLENGVERRACHIASCQKIKAEVQCMVFGNFGIPMYNGLKLDLQNSPRVLSRKLKEILSHLFVEEKSLQTSLHDNLTDFCNIMIGSGIERHGEIEPGECLGNHLLANGNVTTVGQFQRDHNTPSRSRIIYPEDDDIKLEKSSGNRREILDLLQRYSETFHDTWSYNHIYEIQEDGNGEKRNWSPPRNEMRDQAARRSSFQELRNRYFSAEDFSIAGFYLRHTSVIECHSCQSQYEINDVTTAPVNSRWHNRGCQHLSTIRSRENDLQLIESDGRVSDEIADPPGQQSIYIPPGDVRKEAYRLSTFEHFPVTCPISRKSLAKSGFYFTGFYDRVKCFACARTVERWEETDNPAELRWHKETCPLPRGEDCGNVPLRSLLESIVPIVSSGTSAATNQPANQPSTSQTPGQQVLEQRDPNTGAIIRRVRYPADLPERIRQTGGTFEIGPNNEVIIQSGPGPSRQNPASSIGNQATQSRRPWRMANVISSDHKRFLTNLYLNRELDRLASFARWPVGRPNIAPAYLAKSGFFYLGDMDRTQCFSCGGVLRNWKLEDDAMAQHRAHFPLCRMVLGTEPRNIPVHEHPETEEEKERKYPCRFPSNPHMRSEQSRVGTFDRRWSTTRTAATPAEISQAGFFFLGERDRTKCWYCNGGLQNWEYDDVPWVEHAKWFPNCQFLLRVKGQHFVYRHLAVNPHLARPIIARQDGSPLEDVGQPARSAQAPGSRDVPPSEPRPNQPEASPIIIDPQEEMRKRKEKVQNIMRNSDIVKNILTMGFDETIVAGLLEDRINAGNEANPNDVYASTGELLDDVLKKEEEQRNQATTAAAVAATPHQSFAGPSSMGTAVSMYSGISGASGMSSLGPTPGSGKYNVSYFGDDDDEDEKMDQDMYGSSEGTSAGAATAVKQLQGAEGNEESLKEALEKIEEERMCKICFSNQADMVFVPCSHMCCCMECTQSIRHCPVCRKKIEKAIKTYLN